MEQPFVQWIVQAFIGIVVTVAVSQLKSIAHAIQELNRHVAILLERTSTHERKLERHDEEIDQLRRDNNNAKDKGGSRS